MSTGKKIFNFVLLDLLWLVCSLPLVTIGASTCAAFYVSLKMVNDEEVQVVKMFFKAFKQDFIQGTIMLCITSPCAAAGIYMWRYLIKEGDGNLFFLAGALIISLILIVLNIYAYPLIARYSNTTINTIRNSVGLSAQYFKKTMGTILISGIEIALLFFNPLLTFICMFIIPELVIYTISMTAKPIFYRLENPEPVEEEVEEESEEDTEETDEDSEEVDEE